jgi:hypothetical protein
MEAPGICGFMKTVMRQDHPFWTTIGLNSQPNGHSAGLNVQYESPKTPEPPVFAIQPRLARIRGNAVAFLLRQGTVWVAGHTGRELKETLRCCDPQH